MKQVLHIFRKDTRRFWIEIALSIGLLFGSVWAYPAEWTVFHSVRERQPHLILISALGALLVASWWLLITRVVLDEALVGDRQFWLTRPYEWKRLLAAKALFLFCWVGVSYLLAQMVLLAEAGFHPAPYLPGLLRELFLASIIFLLPVLALAVMTATFARMTLTLLGALVLFTSAMSLLSLPHGYTPFVPYRDVFLLPIVFCGCVAAIVLQYRTRRTWWTLGVVAATGLVMAVAVCSYRRQGLLDTAYAEANAAPLTVTYVPSEKFPAEAREYEGEDYIDLPIRYSGVPDGYSVSADNFRFTITSASGDEWTSPWEEMREGRMLPGGHRSVLSLMLSPATFDRFKAAPVMLRIEFGVSRYQAENTTKLLFPAKEVAVPGMGICTRGTNSAGLFYGFPHLLCRSAIDEPPLLYMTAVESNLDCDARVGAEAATGRTSVRADWIVPEGMDFGPASVWTRSVVFYLGRQESDDNDDHPEPRGGWRLCPGDPLTVTPYRLLDRGRTSLVMPNFQLPELKQT